MRMAGKQTPVLDFMRQPRLRVFGTREVLAQISAIFFARGGSPVE